MGSNIMLREWISNFLRVLGRNSELMMATMKHWLTNKVIKDAEAWKERWRKSRRTKEAASSSSTSLLAWEKGTKMEHTSLGTLVVDEAWERKRKGSAGWATIGWMIQLENQSPKRKNRNIFAASILQAKSSTILQGIKDMQSRCNQVQIWIDSQLIIQFLQRP